MIAKQTACVLSLALALSGPFVLGISGAIGCGHEGDANFAHVKPGPMPEGESWSGVYFHPVFGYLHMVEHETSVVGRWKRTDQSAWGELSGNKDGNVFHFTWKEHKYGLVGAAAESHGRGVFVYKVNGEGHGELDGQFGLGNNETGSEWHNIKQQKMAPDLKSITGDTPGGGGASSGFDVR